jgi:hypothetical protein
MALYPARRGFSILEFQIILRHYDVQFGNELADGIKNPWNEDITTVKVPEAFQFHPMETGGTAFSCISC